MVKLSIECIHFGSKNIVLHIRRMELRDVAAARDWRYVMPDYYEYNYVLIPCDKTRFQYVLIGSIYIVYHLLYAIWANYISLFYIFFYCGN